MINPNPAHYNSMKEKMKELRILITALNPNPIHYNPSKEKRIAQNFITAITNPAKEKE